MSRLAFAVLGLGFLMTIAGCGDNTNSIPPSVTESPTYGEDSMKKMKDMMGTPGAKPKKAAAAK